jgi:hypothetical protein
VKTKVNPKYKTKKQTSSGAAVESSVLTECMPESMPDFNNLDIPGLAKMIFNMQREMRSMFNTVQKIDSNMNDMIANVHVRIDNIEKTVEEKVTNNMKKTLDNRITNETNKIKKMVEDKVSDAKRDILAECKADFEGATNNIHDLIDDLKHESKENQSPNGIERNIILRNVSKSNNEDTLRTVNNILADGVRTRVRAIKAERKGSKPGARVIVATMKNASDKKEVLDTKFRLNSSSRYREVFIDSDKSKAERIQSANFRKIIDSVRRGDVNDLEVRGTHVVSRIDRREEYSWEKEHRRGSSSIVDRHKSETSRDRSDILG